VGFLHLPLLPELVTDPEEQPSMARSLQEEGLDMVLDVTAAARDEAGLYVRRTA
jgi:pyrrolidone-carboxylate peptidase